MNPADVEFLEVPWTAVVAVAVLIVALLIVTFVAVIGLCKARCLDSDKPDVSVRLIRKDLLYVVIIFGILVTFILILAFTGEESAFQYFSFASTITSMVLSVIAIIMTIINEQKSDRVRTVIEESVEELKAANNQVKKYADQIDTQRQTLDRLVEKMDKNLKQTKKVLDSTKKLNRRFNNINRDLSTESYEDLNDEAGKYVWNTDPGIDDEVELDDGLEEDFDDAYDLDDLEDSDED